VVVVVMVVVVVAAAVGRWRMVAEASQLRCSCFYLSCHVEESESSAC
jgi:hypothetical protein